MNRDIMRKALLMQIKSLASLAAERVPTFEFDFSDEELNQLDDVSLKKLHRHLHEVVYAPPAK